MRDSGRIVSGVIFDCDGVLADTEATATAVGRRILADQGLHYTDESFRARFIGLGGPMFMAAAEADALERLGRGVGDLWPLLSRSITEAVLAEVQPVPGMAELVRATLPAKAVASASPRVELVGKMAALGLSDQFAGGMWSADDVVSPKPSPDLYLAALAKLEIEAGAGLAIEDSPSGVRAARAAGLRVLGFVGASPHPLLEAQGLLAAGAFAIAGDAGEAAALFQAEGVALSAMVRASGARK